MSYYTQHQMILDHLFPPTKRSRAVILLKILVFWIIPCFKSGGHGTGDAAPLRSLFCYPLISFHLSSVLNGVGGFFIL